MKKQNKRILLKVLGTFSLVVIFFVWYYFSYTLSKPSFIIYENVCRNDDNSEYAPKFYSLNCDTGETTESYGNTTICEQKEVEEIQIKEKIGEDCTCHSPSATYCNKEINCMREFQRERDVVCLIEGSCDVFFIENISKKYLQEKPGWLDENCECLECSKGIYSKEIEKCSSSTFKSEDTKYYPCSKYSCSEGKYIVEVKK